MKVATSQAVFEALRSVIAMPENVVSLELRLSLDRAAEMTIVTHASLHGGEPRIVAPGSTKRYQLVEVTP